MRTYLLALTRNWLSLLGAALTTASAVLILIFFALQLFGFRGGPYDGLLVFTVLPLLLVFGLLLIPIGAWRDRRRTREALSRGEAAPAFPVIDLNRDTVRRAALLILALTIGRLFRIGYPDTTTMVFEVTARNSESVIGIAAVVFAGRPLVTLAILIGPVIELPALLVLTKVMLQLRTRWTWPSPAR